jgi:hypothetical protein
MGNIINHFGEINNGKVCINHQDRVISIEVDDIIKVLLLKRRKLHWNFFLLLISTFFFMVIYSVELSLIFRFISFSIAVIALIMSYFIKLYEHKFVLIKKYDFFEFIIKKSLISDVENLIFKFNLYRNELIYNKSLVAV